MTKIGYKMPLELREKRRQSVLKTKALRAKPVIERFLNFVNKTETCWMWTGTKVTGGYGSFSLKGKSVRAHRFAYEFYKGKIPEGLTIDHLCIVPPCVNPDHLEAVTMRENTLRGTSFAAINAKKTHCIRGHLFNYITSQGYRGCRTCQRILNRRAEARRPHRKHQSRIIK